MNEVLTRRKHCYGWWNVIDYAGNEIKEFEGCLSCAYVNHKFSLPAGMAFENDMFTLSQDWELPITGFYVVTPKRHVENLCELTDDERNAMFKLVNETVKILKTCGVCKFYNIFFEEKPTSHLHVWIMPRHDWMKELFGNPTKQIRNVFDYAKANLRTPDTFKKIKEITNTLKSELKKTSF